MCLIYINNLAELSVIITQLILSKTWLSVR